MPESRVSVGASRGNNGAPQCRFSVGSVSVVVNDDVIPQAAFLLMRTVVEADQIMVAEPKWAPYPVSGLGPGAAWFPEFDQLKAGNKVRLVIGSVTWPGATQVRMIGLARAAMQPYLRSGR